jgi:ATP-dependent DNA ligase
MMLELKPPMEPMEALAVPEVPRGSRWQYEPKWDGFRCLAFRDGDEIRLQSKSGQPLARYFPDLVTSLLALPCRRFVLDGEIVIPISGRLSFDELLLRIHPAPSRVRLLSKKHPAMYIVFDLLADIRGHSLLRLPLEERSLRLTKFAVRCLRGSEPIRVSPATRKLSVAEKWFRSSDGNLDGIVAKRVDLPYRSGKRDGMQKIKHHRTVDCVVGGFRYAERKRVVGSLLLGLYDDQGLLHHVGFTSSFKAADRVKITKLIEPLIHQPGFTGRAPGGPSRWSTRRSSEWQPLRPKLVVEVNYDHFTGDRFRHGTRFLRWRPDKQSSTCTFEQVKQGQGHILKLLGRRASRQRR